MRKIRDLIRLKYQARLSHEQVAWALAVSKGVVAKYVARLERLSDDPAALLERSEPELSELLSPAPRPGRYGGRVAPDFTHIHGELRRPLAFDRKIAMNQFAILYGDRFTLAKS
jgi:hypothetical protein